MYKLVILAILASPATAVTLDLNPAGGSISGFPGDTIGWGFTLDNDTTNWLSVTSSGLTFETNPLLGLYTDFIGLQGGPLPSFALAPFTAWTQSFDGISQGIGAYAISGGAVPFAQNSGLLLMSFDLFDGDPLNAGVQTGSSSISAAFAVNVSAATAVPEPSTLAYAWLAAVVAGLRVMTRRMLVKRGGAACCDGSSRL